MANFTTYNPKSGNAGKTVVTISADKNSTGLNRSEYIRFRQGGKSVVLSIIQNRIEDYEFYTLNPTISVKPEDTVTSTVVYWYGKDAGLDKWTASSNRTWLKVTPTESNEERTDIRLEFGENDGDRRTGTITFSDGRKSAIISFTQSAKEKPDYYPRPSNSQIMYSTTDGAQIDFRQGDFNTTVSTQGYADGYWTVQFNGTVTGCDTVAFRNNSKLSMLSLPESFTAFGISALEGCVSLKDIRIWGDNAPSADDNIMRTAGVVDGVVHIRSDASTRTFENFINHLNNGGNVFTLKLDLVASSAFSVNLDEPEMSSLENEDNETSENG